MSNKNQDSSENLQHLNTFLFVNKTPEIQALEIQNTSAKEPIQLRVDPVTDYTALIITLGVSILVSSITAFVTIWLITRSNNKLIGFQSTQNENQLQFQITQQGILLSHQKEQLKKEVRSKNRQDWVNNVRQLFSNYLISSNQLITNLLNAENTRLQSMQHGFLLEEYKELSRLMRENFNNLNNTAMLINLTLSKDSVLDREIYNLTQDICNSYIALAILINHEITTEVIISTIEVSYLDKFEQKNVILKSNAIFTEKAKLLLKNEWERVKNLE